MQQSWNEDLQGETEEMYGDKPAPVPLHLPRISHEVTYPFIYLNFIFMTKTNTTF
jgi:hypothetical protein